MAGIESLLDQSLLQADVSSRGRSNPEPRFTMLETIREYALELLAASGECRRSGDSMRSTFWCWPSDAPKQNFKARRRSGTIGLTAEQRQPVGGAAWMSERNEVEAGLRLATALEPFW